MNEVANNEVVDNYRYTCTECQFVTKDESEMKLHVEVTHTSTDEVEMSFLCTICSHKFDNRSKLTSHIESVHTNRKTDVSILLNENSSLSVADECEISPGEKIPELNEKMTPSIKITIKTMGQPESIEIFLIMNFPPNTPNVM